MKTHKEIAKDFLILAAKGESRKAFSLYASKDFKHHNVYFRGDAETIMLAMEESALENPDKTIDIKRILHDNDLVAVHSLVKQDKNDLGYALIHIFRFKDDKIVEMCDIGQAVPEIILNENGMF